MHRMAIHDVMFVWRKDPLAEGMHAASDPTDLDIATSRKSTSKNPVLSGDDAGTPTVPYPKALQQLCQLLAGYWAEGHA